MGLLSKLLGREGDDSPVTSPVVSSDQMRASLTDLADALESLVETMRDDESRATNPGWIGRARDLAGAERDLRVLVSQPQFTKDDLHDVLISVRPLYRGATAPQEYAHLEAQNEAVAKALSAVHAQV